MKYFLPDWDDRVDPGYEFLSDRLTLGRDPYRDDRYAHELFEERVYDGLLVSRLALEKTVRKFEEASAIGLRAYLRLPDDLELFGDCGAFGYVSEPDPLFDTPGLLEYYDAFRFDYGVSIDHIILPEFEEQRDYRYRLTIRNAEQFLRQHQQGNYRFTPIGALQGWNAESYAEAARALVQAGYDYLAIGGLARSNSAEVREVVSAVREAAPGIRVHVFGVARASMLPLFVELGITSADSAAPLRQAWLAAKDNYYTLDGALAAIRIPLVRDSRGESRSLVGRSEAGGYELVRAEQEALAAVRGYANRRVGIDRAIRSIGAYDDLLAERAGERDATRRLELYRRTLKARPWDHCGCPVCREIGVETLIFRGNNRNRRRGFHNLWILRQRLARALAECKTGLASSTD